MAERSTYRVGCPEWVFELPLDDGPVLLLVRLWSYVDGKQATAFLDGEGPAPFAFPGRRGLAAERGKTKRTVRRHLEALQKIGVIRRETRVVRGLEVDGYVLLGEPGGGHGCPGEGSEMSAEAEDPPDTDVRPDGHGCPGEGSSVTKRPDTDVPHITPENTHTPFLEQVASAGRATSPPADPEPLKLELAEPDALDPTRLARHVLEASAQARKALGARARITAVTADAQRIVVDLRERLGDVIELPDGPADLRTEAGLRRAWELTIARKLEELRRRAEARGEDPAALARWLRLDALARDAPQLLADGDDLDERRPKRQRGSPRPGSGPPQNGTDLQRYAELNDEGQFE